MSFNRKKRKAEGIRYENNLNAPRFGKSEFTNHLVTKELYAKWLEKTSFKDIKFPKFEKIWEWITDEIQDEVVTNPNGVRLGHYTGDLYLSYVSKQEEIVDHRESDNAGKEIEHLNWNTNKKLGKVIWSVEFASRRNKRCSLYGFEAERKFARNKAAKAFKTTPDIYKDNRLTKAQIKAIKDKNNPWKHGMEILNKKPVETTNNYKRRYFPSEEGLEGG